MKLHDKEIYMDRVKRIWYLSPMPRDAEQWPSGWNFLYAPHTHVGFLYSTVKLPCSNFRVITANFSSVQIFRIFMVFQAVVSHQVVEHLAMLPRTVTCCVWRLVRQLTWCTLAEVMATCLSGMVPRYRRQSKLTRDHCLPCILWIRFEIF